MTVKEKDGISQHLSSSYDLTEYLKKSAYRHSYYKTYSTLERIVQIRDEKVLYLNDGSKWNDTKDRDNFNSPSNPYKNFGKCFSNAKNESVAMWMLYGGVERCGGMIDFTRDAIRSILSVNSVEVGCFKSINGESKFICNITLPKEEFDIFITDIIYYEYDKKYNGKYRIIRPNEKTEYADIEVIDGLSFCKKAMPWDYEKESRLIVSVDKYYLNDCCDTIRIRLDDLDLGNSFRRIYHGPNYPGDDTMYTLQSELGDTVEWSLCSGCTKIVNNQEGDIL